MRGSEILDEGSSLCDRVAAATARRIRGIAGKGRLRPPRSIVTRTSFPARRGIGWRLPQHWRSTRG